MEVEDFIARWTAREGGAERANYQMFLAEFCDVIGVARPEPAGVERERNDYVFERAVRRRASDPVNSSLRIDLYKRGSFILEAKQSRLPGAKNALPDQLALPDIEPERLGRRGAGRNWDTMMAAARRQAEDYVFLLDASHPAPPFVITCDVGHAFEIFSDFTGTGRAYGQFPDRKRFRVYMEDLREPEVRARLARIWTDPASLDPARKSARVTRGIADRLAAVSRSLEVQHDPQEVALFLMRCIFCMFAEDVDLLPKGEFTRLLEECVPLPRSLVPLLEELWAKMDEPVYDRRFFSLFKTHLRHFNGNLYRNARALGLEKQEIGELLAAAKHEWTEVDPAIFGTLLEQALDRQERRRLGAHYTPRAYVQRLVEVTVMEPLREDWRKALTKAQAAKDEGKEKKAIAILRGFLHSLCAVRVLDPACGTGNFLYVGLELMKKLEGEVLEMLARLGFNESLGLERETVEPRQFLGLETNPRAAAIAELVVWIGYLQQHYKTNGGHPGEPILKAFENINFGRKDGYDAVLAWDGYPVPQIEMHEGKPVEAYPHARTPDWPEAEFIVGNPPFIGGKDLRSRLGSAYAEALWHAHKPMNESADFVMYWWDRAAELLACGNSPLRRFGFVTTNSISQVFQRRVMERHLTGKTPISLVFAIPDHPWTKATKDAAAVRIAMTVAEAGRHEGALWEVVGQERLDTDEPRLAFREGSGLINADLTLGTDVSKARALKSNREICTRGVALHGSGFLVRPALAEHLGRRSISGLERHIRHYRNGRDLVARPRNLLVIDLEGLSSEEVRARFPAVYQHVLEHVKPQRDRNNEPYRRTNWWKFGRKHTDLRSALQSLPRYIATVETTKHRVFQFLDTSVLADNKVVCIALGQAEWLAVLSSHIHDIWYLANSGMLGIYDREAVYVKSRCFDPFPFPEPTPAMRERLRAAGEELDATRKRVLEAHADLTLTALYNVLEKLKAGDPLSGKDEDVKQRGLVLILKELHETIDRLTADAYGWPADLEKDQILARLVALNGTRAKEEDAGEVRWLRPDYQAPRFIGAAAQKTGKHVPEEKVVAIDKRLPAFPADRDEQVLAVEAVLVGSGRSMEAAEVAWGFKRGGKRIEKRVGQLLASLARYGHVTALPDGRFAARQGRLAA